MFDHRAPSPATITQPAISSVCCDAWSAKARPPLIARGNQPIIVFLAASFNCTYRTTGRSVPSLRTVWLGLVRHCGSEGGVVLRLEGVEGDETVDGGGCRQARHGLDHLGELGIEGGGGLGSGTT